MGTESVKVLSSFVRGGELAQSSGFTKCVFPTVESTLQVCLLGGLFLPLQTPGLRQMPCTLSVQVSVLFIRVFIMSVCTFQPTCFKSLRPQIICNVLLNCLHILASKDYKYLRVIIHCCSFFYISDYLLEV